MARVGDRSRDVGREVDDDLSVHGQVVVRLLELPRQHLCNPQPPRRANERQPLKVRSHGSRTRNARKEGERTMSSSVEVEHIGHLDVDNSEEALVAFLEFALVKDLDGND